MQERLARGLLVLLEAAAVVGAVWLSLRFLLPWTAPFLAAWALAALLEPAVRFLVRRRWRRSAASALCCLTALGLLGWGLAALLSRGLGAATDFVRELPELVQTIAARIAALETQLETRLRAAGDGSAFFFEQGLRTLSGALSALPAQVSRGALGLLSRAAQASPDILLFLVTAAIGSYFLSASFPKVRAFLLAQLPDGLRQRLEELGTDLKNGFGGVLRAQLILMVMTFFELLTALLLLRVRGAAGIAALTALIDALPVFGTGIVLLPWALGCLLLGDARRGVGLLLAWGVTCLVRSCAQAKLLGDQIGLDPLASLLSVYVGWRVCGVWGMLLFPIMLMSLIQLNARGVVHLWKQTED